MHRPLRRARVVAVALTVALGLAACGSDADSAKDTTAATSAPAVTDAAPATDPAATEAPAATEPAGTDVPAATEPVATEPASTEAPSTTAALPEVPEGTSLRIGDQSGTLELPLTTSGYADSLQESVEYATFVGGPPLMEAFNAGAIDVGYVGDTPPVFAQARGQDVVIVASWHYDGSSMAIVAAPGKGITSVADLAGKKFAYTSGTALQAFALRALDEAGLSADDVEQVDVPILDIVGTLKSGDVDAGVVIEPILTSYLADTPDATLIRDATGLTTGLGLIITTKATLEDPAKAAAVADFVRNEALAFKWSVDHPQQAVEAYAELNQISVEQAQALRDKNGAHLVEPISDEIIAELQGLADIFYDSGAIPDQLDVSQIFDDRFNGQIEAANAT